MEGNWVEGKRILEYEDEEEEEEVVSDIMSYGEERMNKKRVVSIDLYSSKKGSKAGGSVPPSCQVDSCKTDLSEAKNYHRRHKVCEFHAKAPSVLIADQHQRFCQQCSRFHELSEFDESKRSCRRRLAGHNERRRKNAADYNGEGFH
ncbi:hypothetical protein TanjilG_26584 [Lupinus angustifolius]|uniref:Squamosa promoter-binding-like protein n=1 Tax=Lupinus angustifolius TaxID=3871 RepID=A0A4P1QPQ0_LUPAN|nr:PREDICTED: squamosa promoter-binding-like protein 3 [Lupinus angustifolius]OIV91731.1 hypothetical protein TanjilG_26584 [Lupinus angustifolius]